MRRQPEKNGKHLTSGAQQVLTELISRQHFSDGLR
jgi:hypothetical protein